MKTKINNRNKSRRSFLKKSAYFGMASTFALNSSLNFSYAASDKVVAIMPGVFLPKEGRPIVESISKVEQKIMIL